MKKLEPDRDRISLATIRLREKELSLKHYAEKAVRAHKMLRVGEYYAGRPLSCYFMARKGP